MRRSGLIIAMLAACGHPPRPSTGPGSGSAATSPPGAPVVALDAAPVATAPTRDECAAMLGHVFDVAMAARKDPLTADERAAVRSKMIDANTDACLATRRETYDCAMAATTAADLERCPQ